MGDLNGHDNADLPGKERACGQAGQHQDDCDGHHGGSLIGAGDDADEGIQQTTDDGGDNGNQDFCHVQLPSFP